MALISVVIPVFRVEAYLADCLDSVLGQPGDVEVIAVDDASDDGSAEILAGYAARDDRVRVVTLAHNAGLGAARNAGVAAATGDYVWFVDGDDWLPAGSVAAVTRRLRATEPDVLVLGYGRVYADGRVETHLPGVEAGVATDGAVTLATAPRLVEHLWLACTKVFRRAFLPVAFPTGWYEDVAFVLPALLAAERIALLDRDCYAYRQRERQITRTVDDRHFDVFTQWDRVFAFMDADPGRHAAVRPAVFRRMIWHCLQVLGHEQRIARSRRRAYFLRVSAQYHRHQPAAGAPLPGGNEGVKQRLVAAGAYNLYEGLMAAWSAGKRLSGNRRPAPVAAAPAVAPPPRERVPG
ncbi:glycosyltransferase [Asanoa sp. WMMD1127]|uniref:glycosyltransferase family 2 protein n=1 Tax=Asanoa sp. WMMD1127 TaxID=3016107 RepID=UPI00241740C8|nr:glycosyltransferase family 2 protein [Asanoa sp. WMMD1127]MDG4824542.1 glycosyltransferase [Asanoa sp. WMMD1127]